MVPKSPRKDGINWELIKDGGDALMEHMYMLVFETCMVLRNDVNGMRV